MHVEKPLVLLAHLQQALLEAEEALQLGIQGCFSVAFGEVGRRFDQKSVVKLMERVLERVQGLLHGAEVLVVVKVVPLVALVRRLDG